jgi:hypothetical protein
MKKATEFCRGHWLYVVEDRFIRFILRIARLYFDAATFMWIRTDYGKVQISKPMGQFTNAVVPHGEDEMSVDFDFDTSDFRGRRGEAPLQV